MMTQKKDMICKNENAQKNAMSFGQQQYLYPRFSYILNESIFNIYDDKKPTYLICTG